jgi:hypothetical protein
VALVDSVSPHLSNIDVLPLKRKELREYILVSPVSTFRLSHSLTCILLIYIFLACLSLVGNSPSCTSSEFTLCQALKLKKTKNLCSAYSPPSSRPLRSFHLMLREICHGDICFMGLEVEDELWFFFRSVFGLPLPWRINRSFWELPCHFL